MNFYHHLCLAVSLVQVSLSLYAMELPIVQENQITGALQAQAQAGQPYAQYQLAMLLHRQAPQEAVFWFERSAAGGCVDAFVQLGRIASKKNDYEKAVQWFEAAARQNEVQAMLALAKLYEFYDNPKKSFKQAFSLYQKIISIEPLVRDNDDAYNKAVHDIRRKAAYKLGMRYLEGSYGVEQSYEQAIAYFKKALELDSSYDQAAYELGKLYLEGPGKVQKNRQEAYNLFMIATANNHPHAHCLLGNMLYEGKAAALAVAFYKKAVECDDPEAYYRLASCYEQGIGVAQDREAALMFYKAADHRNYKEAKKHVMELGGSKTEYSLKDIAGKIPDDIKDITDFIKNSQKYTEMGARLPKGVLLEGPSGTGKTLIARAIAGEARVPFCYGSASQFVNLYVGQGAANVRALFDKARALRAERQAKMVIIFIDELDAVGGARRGDRNAEYTQTLTELLSQMDGFEKDTDIFYIAATNRAEDLDEALKRPGRFDRILKVGLPDTENRAAILEMYIKKIKHGGDVNVKALAEATAGMSAADLENLVNEAAIIAVREDAPVTTYKHFEKKLQQLLQVKKKR